MALAAMFGMPGMRLEKVEGPEIDDRVEQAHDDEADGLPAHAITAAGAWESRSTNPHNPS